MYCSRKRVENIPEVGWVFGEVLGTLSRATILKLVILRWVCEGSAVCCATAPHTIYVMIFDQHGSFPLFYVELQSYEAHLFKP
jgi:hypothetical protein